MKCPRNCIVAFEGRLQVLILLQEVGGIHIGPLFRSLFHAVGH